MENGLIKSADALEFKVEVSGSGTDTWGAGYGWQGQLESKHTYHPAMEPATVVFLLVAYDSYTDTTTYSVSAPFIGWSDEFSGEVSGELKVRFNDFKLYVDGYYGGWIVKYSGVEILIDDGVVSSYGGRTLSEINSAPSYIPLLGIPPHLSCGAGPRISLAALPCGGISPITETEASSKSITANGTASGGWRFVNGIISEEFPVNIEFIDPPLSSGCNDDMPDVPE